MFVDLVNSEDVLKAVQAKGPAIPMDIRKFLGKGDSITIGAALSSLSSKGLVKCTNVKMGGSPFYYVRGQENKLESLSNYLNEKDKRTFEEIRSSKVLKDSVQEPLIRVSLRNIPDFAKKIELTNNDEKVLFWRWYMISEEEAISIIKGGSQRKQVVEPSQEVIVSGSVSEERFISEEPQANEVIEVQEKEVEQVTTRIEEKIPESKEVSSEPVKVVPKKESETQRTVSEDVEDFDDSFFKKIKKFFEDNNIYLKNANLIRKGSEYDLIISMKTPFGETDYFCKAKSKKKCNEGDLSSAYLQGQNKRLPTVFLTTGEITKKAKQKAHDEYKGLLIKEL